MNQLGVQQAGQDSIRQLLLDFAELAFVGTSGPWLGYSASSMP